MHDAQNGTPAGAAPTPRDVALRLGVLTVLKARVTEAEQDARRALAALMAKGDTTVVTNPVNPVQEIATVTRSKPKPKADVTSRSKVEEWVRANYPGKVETKTRVTGPQHEVLEVLREHAPWLIEDTTVVPDYVVNELCLLASRAGEPVGFGGEMGEHAPPGITVNTPEGSLRVTVAAGGVDVVEEMWAAGVVDLDGQVLALPAGGEA